MIRHVAVGVVLAAALPMLSCSHHGEVAQHWGDAFLSNRAAMIANPDAPPWGSAPVGLDPGTAERVAQRYYEGQRKGALKEPPAPTVLIQTD